MTLIEILVVLVILGVMLLVTVPTLGGLNQGNKLRAAAREIVALSKQARSEAVFGNRTTEVFLDLEKHQYWLDLRTPDPKTKKAVPYAKRKLQQVEMVRGLDPSNQKDPKILFEEVSVYEQNKVKEKLIAIDFYPDGSASPALIMLRNSKNQHMTIEIMKATGMAEVSRGTIEQRVAKKDEEGAPPPPPPSGGAV